MMLRSAAERLRRIRVRVVSWQASALCGLLLSALLVAWWTETGRLRITGDEPHYLIR